MNETIVMGSHQLDFLARVHRAYHKMQYKESWYLKRSLFMVFFFFSTFFFFLSFSCTNNSRP